MAFAVRYPLPHPFPNGRVWAAVKYGKLVNMVYMVYMAVPDGIHFNDHRQKSRAALADLGKVLTGEVRDGFFVPRVEEFAS